MPYVMDDNVGDLGLKVITDEDMAAIQGRTITSGETVPTTVIYGTLPTPPPAPTTSTPTTRPWPGAGGAIVQMPGGASGAGTAVSPTSTAGKPAGTMMGQNYAKPGYATPGGKPTGTKPTGIKPTGVKPTGVKPTGYPATSVGITGSDAAATPPDGFVPTDVLPPSYEAPTSSGAPGESFFDQYKWWIIGGAVALVGISIGAYLLLRKGGATAGLGDDDDDLSKCRCGSGEPRYPLHDARGIFVAYTCDKCIKKVKSGYRKDIFEDPSYWTDEPVEPEDYY